MVDEKQADNAAKPARPDLQFDPRDVRVRNTSGSTAGSGSGDFHVYRQERLRELTRLKTLEAEAAAKVEQDAKLAEYQARVEKEAARSQSRYVSCFKECNARPRGLEPQTFALFRTELLTPTLPFPLPFTHTGCRKNQCCEAKAQKVAICQCSNCQQEG